MFAYISFYASMGKSFEIACSVWKMSSQSYADSVYS